jgi:ring-1,2-phenylacetyl-CoA epoxidase subunit PaaE
MAPAPRFHALAIRDLRRETADAVSIAFTVPEALRETFAFTPGQYLTVRTVMDGEEVRRSYSISSGLDDGELRIAVKRVDGGAFSSFANTGLKPGDVVEVMPPMGRFAHAPAPAASKTYVGFACGSGITPVISIIRTVLAREPESRFFLFYGNRATGSIIFREALEDLKDRHLDRLSVFHVLSRETQDISILNGRLDGAKAKLLIAAMVPGGVDEAFVCGPSGMLDSVEAALLASGLPRAAVHVERFTSADGAVSTAPRRPAVVIAAETPKAVATIVVDGIRTDVPVADGEAVIDAALRAGLDLPFSCKGGMCCTCRAKVTEGAVVMDVNYSLQPWELEAGFVLTCQAKPTTERVTVDYDAM